MERRHMQARKMEARNIEAMLRRTPPHLLNQRSRKRFKVNESNATDSSASLGGGSSFLPQNHITYGFAGSDPRAESHQLPHQPSSFQFYPVVPRATGNQWEFFHRRQPAQYHCDQLGRKEQPPLPSSCWSSQNNSAGTRLTSSSVLCKQPAGAGNPAWSSFQPPPPPDADDMALARGPQCELQTDDLLSLVQSIGTPEFLANSEVLSSGSSLHKPCRARCAANVLVSSNTMSAPSLDLGLGTGSGDGRKKGKEVSSYWDLSAMAKTMEYMKKQRQETSQSLPVKTLGLDGQGCSKNTLHRRP